MSCTQLKNNQEKCTCTATSCSRYGNCCACIAYHRERDELPGCLFSPEAEKTYNRSVQFFIESREN